MGNYSIAFFSINYLHVLMDNYVAFFMKFKFTRLIDVTFRIQINATYFPILDHAQDFFFIARRLIQQIKNCIRNKHKITCPLVDANFNLLEFHSMST